MLLSEGIITLIVGAVITALGYVGKRMFEAKSVKTSAKEKDIDLADKMNSVSLKFVKSVEERNDTLEDKIDELTAKVDDLVRIISDAKNKNDDHRIWDSQVRAAAAAAGIILPPTPPIYPI